MALRIKPGYEDIIWEKNDFGIGKIIFNPFFVNPKNYVNFFKLGFDIFEEYEELTIEQEVENYING